MAQHRRDGSRRHDYGGEQKPVAQRSASAHVANSRRFRSTPDFSMPSWQMLVPIHHNKLIVELKNI
jgi:hypothetical protein